MAGRGRGRGAQSLSFNLPGLGSGDSMPSVTLQPPPLYPILHHRVTPLSSTEVDEYMLALSREFRTSIRDSPFFLKEKVCKKDIVRYTDRYKQTTNIDAKVQWEPDWNLFPNELKPKKQKKIVKATQEKPVKKKVNRLIDDLSTDDIVQKLELTEEIEKEEGKEKGEEKENEEDEAQDEEEEVDVSEDDNDYNFDYYDDGGDNYADDNDGEEGPVY
ncbi:DNA-directed RNA polymerase III subunit RPC7-like isoform X1 [Hydra vulgaris]|nr:DNA-directed RNA polymerase III subunit RPC7-like [Hydra vulgaris]